MKSVCHKVGGCLCGKCMCAWVCGRCPSIVVGIGGGFVQREPIVCSLSVFV